MLFRSLGADSTSIANAVNRLQELGGGAVIADGQSILAEVPAPIAAIMSAEPLPTLVTQLRHLKTTLRELGCPWPDPLLAVDVLSTAAIPHFRITDRGYARVRDGSGAGLWAN